MSEHFVAAYQQAGDFEVVEVNGTLQKNGGNVATCFCTADARVIHAVGGPVSADRLLEEARWTVDVVTRIEQQIAEEEAETDKEVGGQRRAELVQEAHLAALYTSPAQFVEAVRWQGPQAQQDYLQKAKKCAGQRSAGRYARRSRVPPVEVLARRKAAEQLPGTRAHKIFAAEPLAPFQQIGDRVFERLTGETYTDDRGRVYLAAEALKYAEEQAFPVMFVFYKGHGPGKDEYDGGTERLLNQVFSLPHVRQPLQSYMVIVLPLRQLPALTQLVDLPTYQLASRSSTNLILARSDGTQLVSLNGSVHPDELAIRLWPPLQESCHNRADMLDDAGEGSAAIRLLRKVLASPLDETMRERTVRRVSELTFQEAEECAAAGRITTALRFFRRARRETPDDKLRELAGERMAELRANRSG